MFSVVTKTIIPRKYFLYFGTFKSQPHAIAINSAVMSTSIIALIDIYSASKKGIPSPVSTPLKILINLNATLALSNKNPPINRILAILFLLSISYSTALAYFHTMAMVPTTINIYIQSWSPNYYMPSPLLSIIMSKVSPFY